MNEWMKKHFEKLQNSTSLLVNNTQCSDHMLYFACFWTKMRYIFPHKVQLLKVKPPSLPFRGSECYNLCHNLGKCLLHASVHISSMSLIKLIKHSRQNQQTRRKSALMNKDEGKRQVGCGLRWTVNAIDDVPFDIEIWNLMCFIYSLFSSLHRL